MVSFCCFSTCTLEPCVFYHRKPNPTWLYIHIDNIEIFGKDVEKLNKEIALEFEIINIGPADLILGVNVNQTKDGIWLYQKHFSKFLVKIYGIGECRPVLTPLVPHSQLSQAMEEELKELNNLIISYRSTVCNINYLSSTTRPDLSFAVSSLSQYLKMPGIHQWHGFLQSSLDIGLLYS
ncbi:hypothetical protein O181_008882 [Austropuccinia psidii MF-1]|uniref:Uncharacterized protein n=1 Tax=Austropuccinia psidii MF-1 TaxID=1389203 RepID=A0A9Q3GJT0_9BASI|nr:hypothetical protein [Austropuccinia psidii MF-1]